MSYAVGTSVWFKNGNKNKEQPLHSTLETILFYFILWRRKTKKKKFKKKNLLTQLKKKGIFIFIFFR